MPGDSCIVCGNSRAKTPQLSFHRFPSDPQRRSEWLEVFQLREDQVKPHHRVCSRHFPGGNPHNKPDLSLGKRFASPVKKGCPRTKRAKQREAARELATLQAESTRSANELLPRTSAVESEEANQNSAGSTPMVVPIGEQLQHDYQVYELPDEIQESPACVPQPSVSSTKEQALLNSALIARIEYLEAENARLRQQKVKDNKHFSIDTIKHDDGLVRFYTGFTSYGILLAFYHFLGPAVDHLQYWGVIAKSKKRNRPTKLTPIDQFFLTLVKLKLNLKVKDLALRFGISPAAVSRYFTTWICFLYKHLTEINWMPSVEQVLGTLPSAFREHYPTTYTIIDGSEIFIQTPSDLHMQSSTWSSYKHHNTAKFLIGCTPNGCISFISQLYVGSISDVEITRVSGFLDSIEGKQGISIMADRGFTIKDLLKEIGVELNIPPFMEGRDQLPSEEVKQGRQIASVRIHVERAIGRIKTFSILKHTMPISLARLSNQVVCVCAFLSNFKPVLVPGDEVRASAQDEDDVDDYFRGLSDSSDSSDDED